MRKKLKNNYSQQHITVYKEGQTLSQPQAVHENCVEDDGTFMPDYIWNAGGGLQELHYDMIDHLEK